MYKATHRLHISENLQGSVLSASLCANKSAEWRLGIRLRYKSSTHCKRNTKCKHLIDSEVHISIIPLFDLFNHYIILDLHLHTLSSIITLIHWRERPLYVLKHMYMHTTAQCTLTRMSVTVLGHASCLLSIHGSNIPVIQVQ